MKWGLWSTTAGSNSATPPDGWPEGQAPSTVNDCAREMMAQIAVGLQDLQFIDLGMVPTQTSGNTFTVSGNFTTVLQYGRRIKASDGANLLYGTIISASFTANTGVTLRFDNGNAPLDSSLSAFAVGVVANFNAAIPDALYKHVNWFINPMFDVWQRGNGPFGLSGNTATITADNWKFGLASGSINVSRGSNSTSNVPSLAQCGQVLKSSVLISVSAIQSLSTGSLAYFEQRVVGADWRQFGHKPMTVTFWQKSNTTGTYCLYMQNSTGNMNYVAAYSLSSTSWEKKSFFVPKAPTTGTWDYSFGIGVRVGICLAAGGTFNTAASGQWSATQVYATSGQLNFMGNTSNVVRFAAFTLQEGLQTAPPEPRRYADEVAKCEQQLYVIDNSASSNRLGIAYGLGTGGSTVDRMVVNLPTTMLGAPVLSSTTGLNTWNGITLGTLTSPITNIGLKTIGCYIGSSNVAYAAGNSVEVLVPANGKAILKFEL